MIKETEHFILTGKPFQDAFGNTWTAPPKDGLLIKIKNKDGTSSNLVHVLPNNQTQFMKDPGCYLSFDKEVNLQCDLLDELIPLIKEAKYRVGMAIVGRDFDKCLD